MLGGRFDGGGVRDDERGPVVLGPLDLASLCLVRSV